MASLIPAPNKLDVYGAALGAGLAYSLYSPDLLSAGVGAVGGYLLFPKAQIYAMFSAPSPYSTYLLSSLAGAGIAYGLYGSNLPMVGAGAAVASGALYVVAK